VVGLLAWAFFLLFSFAVGSGRATQQGKSLPDAPPLWLALRGSFGEAVEPYSSSIKRVGLQRIV
jgi:hypothetical protein